MVVRFWVLLSCKEPAPAIHATRSIPLIILRLVCTSYFRGLTAPFKRSGRWWEAKVWQVTDKPSSVNQQDPKRAGGRTRYLSDAWKAA